MQGDLHGTVGVLGYGVDGRCTAEWLEKQPHVERVLVFDDREMEMRKCENAKMRKCGNAEMRPSTALRIKKCGKGESLDGIGLLFRSPGFPLTHPLVIEAKERGIPITSSTTYFLQHFPGVTVGVTGSNGKTTCTALITEMLKAQYGNERVERGGNDGVPRLDLLSNYQLPITNYRYVVLELSSFQLIDCPVSPNVAVVLNITKNHLNWHASMEEYVEAKRRIVAHPPSPRSAGLRRGKSVAPTQVAILNQNDHIVRTFAEGLKGEVRWFDQLPVTSYRLRCKTHPDTIRAAVTAARALNVSENNIIRVLQTFPGVPQRIEFVRELDGVKWYNDSSSTTPESAIVACESFPKGSVVLLLGGRDKGMDFSRLYEVIQARDVLVVPYGEMADTFQKNIPTHYKLQTTNSFTEAIETARHVGRPNVVLSPACASFDMFKDAKERGKKYTELVRALQGHRIAGLDFR